MYSRYVTREMQKCYTEDPELVSVVGTEQNGNMKLDPLGNNVNATDTTNDVPLYKYSLAACDQTSSILCNESLVLRKRQGS